MFLVQHIFLLLKAMYSLIIAEFYKPVFVSKFLFFYDKHSKNFMNVIIFILMDRMCFISENGI